MDKEALEFILKEKYPEKNIFVFDVDAYSFCNLLINNEYRLNSSLELEKYLADIYKTLNVNFFTNTKEKKKENNFKNYTNIYYCLKVNEQDLLTTIEVRSLKKEIALLLKLKTSSFREVVEEIYEKINQLKNSMSK